MSCSSAAPDSTRIFLTGVIGDRLGFSDTATRILLLNLLGKLADVLGILLSTFLGGAEPLAFSDYRLKRNKTALSVIVHLFIHDRVHFFGSVLKTGTTTHMSLQQRLRGLKTQIPVPTPQTFQ
jgi:hypothetical protein